MVAFGFTIIFAERGDSAAIFVTVALGRRAEEEREGDGKSTFQDRGSEQSQLCRFYVVKMVIGVINYRNNGTVYLGTDCNGGSISLYRRSVLDKFCMHQLLRKMSSTCEKNIYICKILFLIF